MNAEKTDDGPMQFKMVHPGSDTTGKNDKSVISPRSVKSDQTTGPIQDKDPIISIRNISKVYNRTVSALNEVTLDVKRGEWISIVGPSGSGKTTLVNMVAGLDSPSSGSIIIDGENITKLKEGMLARFRQGKCGYIFQQFHLVPYLSALENVMLADYFKNGRVNGETKKRAKKTLESVGLGSRIDHKPGQLSGGEQQRVAIARALVNEPSILFADEPTGNLDQNTGREIIALLDNLNKNGHTIVMITHDEHVAKHASRIVKMVDGKITTRNINKEEKE